MVLWAIKNEENKYWSRQGAWYSWIGLANFEHTEEDAEFIIGNYSLNNCKPVKFEIFKKETK